MEFVHKSVLLEESINWLITDKDGIYVDCTMGGAGHSKGFAMQLSSRGTLVAIDQDDDAIAAASVRLQGLPCKIKIAKSNFKNFDDVLDGLDIDKIDGIFFDLGVSSYQLDTPERGFSYMHDGPLDMRMDKESKKDAYYIVNRYKEEELADIIYRYGEERWSKRIAQFIVKERSEKPIKTTFELVNVIKKAIPKGARQDGPHPAKRTFQAIRIEVNDELNILENVVTQAVERLKSGGRIGVITFHSLEDRIVKQTLAQLAKGCICPPQLPVCVCGRKPLVKKVGTVTLCDQTLIWRVSMLARKYDNYAWEEIEYERPVERVRKVKKVDYKLVRRRAAVLVLLVMVAYFAAVARSESLVRTGDELVALKQQEATLLLKNSEIKIEVEQLKGPERVTSIAEKQLGMTVARNNIYVKADSRKVAYDGYAYAK